MVCLQFGYHGRFDGATRQMLGPMVRVENAQGYETTSTRTGSYLRYGRWREVFLGVCGLEHDRKLGKVIS